ncbi:hypothetical protein HKX48_005127 [Thoreauomyces humboldtii]|nr:hypothetical protein HKX48_005127 [Thoreauomyces humboldtii]
MSESIDNPSPSASSSGDSNSPSSSISHRAVYRGRSEAATASLRTTENGSWIDPSDASVPETDSEHDGTGSGSEFYAGGTDSPEEAWAPARVQKTSSSSSRRRASSVDVQHSAGAGRLWGASKVKVPLVPVVAGWAVTMAAAKPDARSSHALPLPKSSPAASDSDSDGVVSHGRRGVYIPSEFRDPGPVVVPTAHEVAREVSIDDGEEDSDVINAQPAFQGWNEQESPRQHMAQGWRPGDHERVATPPPIIVRDLRSSETVERTLQFQRGGGMGRLAKWQPVTLTPTVEETRSQADSESSSRSGALDRVAEVGTPKPAEEATVEETASPTREKSFAMGWRSRMQLFQSRGNARGSTNSMGDEKEKGKRNGGAVDGSQATLGGSSASLSGSQTNMALPKSAESDTSPAPVKHKWFHPLFPRMGKESKNHQHAVDQERTTVNLLHNISTPSLPDPFSPLRKISSTTRRSKEDKSSRRRRAREVPLFQRLMMRREKAVGRREDPLTDSDTSEEGEEASQYRTPGSHIRNLGHHPHAKPLVLRESSQDLFGEDSESVRQQFERDYKIIRRVGAGGHSTVRLAAHQATGELVVCKFISERSVWHWVTTPSGAREPLEQSVMSTIATEGGDGADGMIRLLGFYNMDPKFVIVMEYLGEDWVDLYDYIEEFGPVDEEGCREIFGQVVRAVEYLHWIGYVHNDIKDENIMINKYTRQTKLIDFGSATRLVPGSSTSVFYGTRKFASPEAVAGVAYRPEAQEVWALGTLLFVLLFKIDPFKNDDEIADLEVADCISQLQSGGKGENRVEVSNDTVDLLRGLLEKDWGARLRVGEILRMPFFTNVTS